MGNKIDMDRTNMSLADELKSFFGFNQFKGSQEAIIQSILDKKDTFVIMPTGGGKSLCYQLPAIMNKGTAIIVSPLIALMKNQVDSIRSFATDQSIAHVLNSSLSKKEAAKVKEDIMSERTKLLYVAPESLTKEENIEFFKNVHISFLAVDEAHCISEWGHDFRPEYRNLSHIIKRIGKIPLIALTATATKKVQEDIQKNLGMENAQVFKSSFNRENLYYEIRPKVNPAKEIIKYIKKHTGKSGIIYCISRKKVEELAETLQVNGIKALPYHAGLDATTRARHQDEFLMEDVDVIVATIAFGMGIDKPDVRFVIHHDMPKSLESYYQETGRGGRDGGEGNCIAFYSYKDIEKLEKFMQGKPVAEQEVGRQLLMETVSYAETSMCRRKYLLHYFGEEFDSGNCNAKCDNCKHPKKKVEGREDVQLLLQTIRDTREKFKPKDIVAVLTGKINNTLKEYQSSQLEVFGKGSEKSVRFWHAVVRQVYVSGMLRKDIESYGILKLTESAKSFLESPQSFMITEDHNFDELEAQEVSSANTKSPFDKVLLEMLKELRKEVAKKKDLPPYILFQDPSLEDMTIQYPTTIDELKNINGVGNGKASRYGKPFIELIDKYVTENNIEKPQDMVVKSIINKSGLKVYIIQSSDRKLPLDDIAGAKGIEMSKLLEEIENIVYSGTKINLNYYIDDILDEEQQEEITEYFMESDSDSIEDALEEFDGDYTEEELRLMRIQFTSDIGN